ncbi:MAG: nucleotidyltransferase domain-containing protein [Clostridia bacterium]|nr:nucleotidyltransferase domain-containing protein [Clostridia bacterium]
MKIHEVFERKVNELKADENVKGIFITGSLARGTETEYSDLDIIVISDKDEVVEEVIEGVPVETHYNRVESVKKWFVASPPSCYLYTYGKIVWDREGVLSELQDLACDLLDKYEVLDVHKVYLSHKLSALKEKLTASIALNDSQKISYLIHNNFKIIVESIYAVNSLPVPPQGLNYEIYGTLKQVPSKEWLKLLITLQGLELAEYVMGIIEFCKNLLV